MVDYAKLKVEDIKRMIVNEGHCTEDQIGELDIKGKARWVNLHKEFNGIEVEEDPIEFIFDIPEELTEVKVMPEAEVPKTPRYYDVEWQDYVMSQFDKSELVLERKTGKKYPNVNGLRRVVELLLGEIMQAGPVDMKTTMDPDSPGKAVVTYEISIAWKLDAGPYINLDEDREIFPIKIFRAVGSAWHGNTDDAYAVFPEAIAETRAEGRALRRALRLGVVCSDELTRKDTAEIVRQKIEKTTDGNWEESSFITDNQTNSINLLCNRLGINVTKFINSGSKTYDDMSEISRQTAANMIKRLNAYQTSGSDSVEIPDNILEKKE